MHIQHLLAVSGLLFLGNAGLSMARLDESNVPSGCKDICGPVVQASQKCDRNVPDRETRMECKCTWIQLKTSGTVSSCHRCMHQDHGRDWNKRDDYDSDDSDDDSDDDDDDHDGLYQSCRAKATDSPATTSTTMTMQPSASATKSESAKTTSSSSLSTPSSPSTASPSTEVNGAGPLSISASLAAVAGLVTFAWL